MVSHGFLRALDFRSEDILQVARVGPRGDAAGDPETMLIAQSD